jgi:hypothetical protein
VKGYFAMPDETNTKDTGLEATSIPKEVQEVIEKLPSNAMKNKALHAISESIQIRPHMPYEDIMTTENLSAIIENSDKQSQREFEITKSNNKYQLLTLVIGLGFMFGVIFLLKSNSELLLKILLPLITLVAGAFGGYGYGYKKGKSDLE